MKPKMTAGRAMLYVVLIIYALITLYPFLWMVAASFKPLREIVGGNMSLISENMTLDNYKTIFGHSSLFPRWFLNSLFVATVGTVINVYINSMAGYSLSRLSFPGRDKIYHGLLLLMMIPGQVLLIPNYLLLKEFGMNFPKDVCEAAEIDGLSRYGVFFRIAMPLARPTIATTAIFGFMGFWNAFTAPMLYIKTASKYTLTLGLQSFQSQNAGTMWNQVMAAACISVLPIIILYLIFNKFFMVGLRMDGEK